MILHHLALVADWDAARDAGDYRISTRGMTLEQVGYIHASHAHQWRGVRRRFYADVPDDDLVLLDLDTGLLGVPVVEEPADPDDPASELFPHVRGPIPCTAVVAVRPLSELD